MKKKMMVGLLMAMTFVVCGQAAPSDAVCKIGSTQFASLSDAFASPLLQEPGVTNMITLLRDIDGGCYTNVAGSCAVLDLNGHILHGGGIWQANRICPIIQNNGTLIIDDSSQSCSGAIMGFGVTGFKGSRKSCQGIYNTGCLLMRKGLITDCCEDDDYGPDGSAVTVAPGATFVMDGGVISNNWASGGADSSSACVTVRENAEFVMHGGHIDGACETVVHNWGGHLFLLGGTIRSEGYDNSVLSQDFGGFAGVVYVDGCKVSRLYLPFAHPGLEILSGKIKYLELDTLSCENSKGVNGGVFGSIRAVTSGEYRDLAIGDTFADSYIVVANTDPKTKDEYPLTVQGVAKIGEVQFGSLAEAFSSPLLRQPGVTNTITLLRDVAANNLTLTAEARAILDLNGFAIEAIPPCYSTPLVVNAGTLIVDDSSIEKTGRISGASVTPCVANYGVFILQDGSICDGFDWDGFAGVGNMEGASFVMDGGVITNCYVDGLGGAAVRTEGSFVMNAGLIVDCLVVDYESEYGVVYGHGIIVINGGEIRGNPDLDSYQILNLWGSVIVTGGFLDVRLFMDGADFVARGGVFAEIDCFYTTSVDISGGRFDCLQLGSQYWGYASDVVINGGVFGEVIGHSVGDIVGGSVLVANTDPATKDAYPLTVRAATPLDKLGHIGEVEKTFDGWKVTVTNDAQAVVIGDAMGNVILDLKGLTVRGTNGVVGTTTTPGGNGGAAIEVVKFGDAGTTVLTLTNSAASAVASVIGGHGGDGNPGGDGGPGVRLLPGVKVNVGAGIKVIGGNGGRDLSSMGRGGNGGAGIEGDVGTNEGVISGGNGGSSSGGTGGKGGNGVTGDIDVDAGDIEGGSGGSSETGTPGEGGKSQATVSVARIGTVKFAKLQDAFASPLLQEPGATNTVTLLRDVSTGSVTNGLGCSTILDLNGHVINGTSSPIFVNCGTLVVDDLSKVGEGRISGGGGYPGLGIQLTTAFLNKGQLQLKNGTIADCCMDYWGGMYAGAVDNRRDATFVMNGGMITNCVTRDGGAAAVYTEGNFVLTGGLIVDCGIPETEGYVGGIVQVGGECRITGGVVTNCYVEDSGADASIEVSSGKLSISGGDFSGYVNVVACDEVLVSGGHFAGKIDVGVYAACDHVTITGGWISSFSYGGQIGGSTKICGGIFGTIVGGDSVEHKVGDMVPGGYVIVANTDPATKDAYSLTVSPQTPVEQFGHVGEVEKTSDGWKVTVTNDAQSVVIGDAMGNVTLDLKGLTVRGTNGVAGTTTTPGGNGGAAIEIVKLGDAGTTVLTLINSAASAVASVIGGHGGDGNPGGDGGPGIRLLPGIKVNIGAGIKVIGGNGGRDLSGAGRGGNGGAGVEGYVDTNEGEINSGEIGTDAPSGPDVPDDHDDNEQPTLFVKVVGGSVNPKGATYNGFLGEESLDGTFTLVIKAPKKGTTLSVGTLTKLDAATGKKVKVTGNIDINTGVGSGGLAGLLVGVKSVTGSLVGVTAQGAIDAVKAKDADALKVMEGFNKLVYAIAYKTRSGDTAMLTATFSAKGRVKITGTIAGVKVSGTTQMSVGDELCAVPFASAKKGASVAFVLWFDKRTKELTDVTGLGAGAALIGAGASGVLSPGDYRFIMTAADVLGSVPDAIDETPLETAVKFNGGKFDAGKAAKVAYKNGETTVDVSKGGNISCLALKCSKGLLTGSCTIYALTNGKLVKNKFSVMGVVLDGVGYAAATNKKLKPIPVVLKFIPVSFLR